MTLSFVSINNFKNRQRFILTNNTVFTFLTSMKKLFSNNSAMIILAIISLLIGFIYSLIIRDFAAFQRSGALLVAIGIILLSRTFIVGRDLLINVRSSDTPYNINGPDHYMYQNLPIPEYVNNDIESRKAIGWIGPLISSIGTIVWGYGDLLNLIFYATK